MDSKTEHVLRNLSSIYQDDYELKQLWLNTYNDELEGIPRDLITTLDGYRQVLHYIESIR